MFAILSFVGDNPVPSQPYWNREYFNKGMAVKLAKLQHKILIRRWPNLYTIVIDKDTEVIVEWMIYMDKEIEDNVAATKLAEKIYEEGKNVSNG